MTGGDLFREIGNISEEYVVEAENYKKQSAGVFHILKNPSFRKTLVTAACLVICVGLVFTVQKLGVRMDSAAESAMDGNETGFEMAAAEAPAAQDMAAGDAAPADVPAEESLKDAVAQKAPDTENAFIIIHGSVESGQELWDDFCMMVDEGMAAQIDIIRFTVEGDPIIETVSYDGEMFHLLVDNSRDAFRGSGEAYYEASYKYMQQSIRELENGKQSVEYMLTNSEKSIQEVLDTGNADEKQELEYYSIAYIVE